MDDKKKKILVVFYSRSGTTKKLAEKLHECLSARKSEGVKADIEEIFDLKDRKGMVGYLSAGKDSSLKKLTAIKKTEKDPAEYEVVAIGTPVWAFTMSSAIRTYIAENKDRFKNVAFFSTYGSGIASVFGHMEELCGKAPVTAIGLPTVDVRNGNYSKKAEEFAEIIAKFIY